MTEKISYDLENLLMSNQLAFFYSQLANCDLPAIIQQMKTNRLVNKKAETLEKLLNYEKLQKQPELIKQCKKQWQEFSLANSQSYDRLIVLPMYIKQNGQFVLTHQSKLIDILHNLRNKIKTNDIDVFEFVLFYVIGVIPFVYDFTRQVQRLFPDQNIEDLLAEKNPSLLIPSLYSFEEAEQLLRFDRNIEQQLIQKLFPNYTRGEAYQKLKTIQQLNKALLAMINTWFFSNLMPIVRKMISAGYAESIKLYSTKDWGKDIATKMCKLFSLSEPDIILESSDKGILKNVDSLSSLSLRELNKKALAGLIAYLETTHPKKREELATHGRSTAKLYQPFNTIKAKQSNSAVITCPFNSMLICSKQCSKPRMYGECMYTILEQWKKRCEDHKKAADQLQDSSFKIPSIEWIILEMNRQMKTGFVIVPFPFAWLKTKTNSKLNENVKALYISPSEVNYDCALASLINKVLPKEKKVRLLQGQLLHELINKPDIRLYNSELEGLGILGVDRSAYCEAEIQVDLVYSKTAISENNKYNKSSLIKIPTKGHPDAVACVIESKHIPTYNKCIKEKNANSLVDIIKQIIVIDFKSSSLYKISQKHKKQLKLYAMQLYELLKSVRPESTQGMDFSICLVYAPHLFMAKMNLKQENITIEQQDYDEVYKLYQNQGRLVNLFLTDQNKFFKHVELLKTEKSEKCSQCYFKHQCGLIRKKDIRILQQFKEGLEKLVIN